MHFGHRCSSPWHEASHFAWQWLCPFPQRGVYTIYTSECSKLVSALFNYFRHSNNPKSGTLTMCFHPLYLQVGELATKTVTSILPSHVARVYQALTSWHVSKPCKDKGTRTGSPGSVFAAWYAYGGNNWSRPQQVPGKLELPTKEHPLLRNILLVTSFGVPSVHLQKGKLICTIEPSYL